MVSHPLVTPTPQTTVTVKMGDIALKSGNETKFLGIYITIDKCLMLKPHIDDLKSQISKVNGI